MRWRPAAQAGVVRMLEILEDEVQRSLGLLGVNTFADLNKSYLHLNAPVVTVPSVFSAFPLRDDRSLAVLTDNHGPARPRESGDPV